jgi:16S rRNA (adenine1518-N6/adenine1519-N6)-dimethyltransferase
MVQAKKALGQHFLSDPGYGRRIVTFAGVRPDETVVEIGPGTGQLTALLLDAAARVVAIEFDRDMIEFLENRFSGSPAEKLKLIRADVLGFDWERLAVPERFLLLGNLPYNIATRILSNSIAARERFRSFTFMVQKEVAERVLAEPGHKEYGYFTVLLEAYFERQRGFDVPPGAFRPRPKVTSHVMTLIPRPDTSSIPPFESLERLLARAFTHRRKTLWNNLAGRYGNSQLRQAFEAAAIELQARPEVVSLQQYLCLTRVL